MSAPDSTSTPLHFDTATPQSIPPGGSTGAVTCAPCGRTLFDEYFDVGGKTVCESCSQQIAQQLQVPRGLAPLARASLFGLAAAVAGAVLYYAVIAITNFEIGIVAIAIGYMVGYAVHVGAGRRGGRRFQVAAALLTYWAVGLAYTPMVFQSAAEETAVEAGAAAGAGGDAAAPAAIAAAGAEGDQGNEPSVSLGGALAIVLGLTFALPVMVVIGSMPGGLISAAIIGFGVHQAWQMTGAAPLSVTGPYRITASPPALS